MPERCAAATAARLVVQPESTPEGCHSHICSWEKMCSSSRPPATVAATHHAPLSFLTPGLARSFRYADQIAALEEHALLDALDAEWYVDAGEGKEKGCKGRELRPQYEQAVNRPKPKKKGKKAE